MSLEESYVVALDEIQGDCVDTSDHLTPALREPGANFRLLLAADAVERGYRFIANAPETPAGQVSALVFHERKDGDPWDWVVAERLSDTEILLRLRAEEVQVVAEKVFFDIRCDGPCGDASLDPVIPGIGVWK